MLLFRSFINQLLTPANTSFHTYKTLTLLYGEAQFLLKVPCNECDSVFYCLILNIKRLTLY